MSSTSQPPDFTTAPTSTQTDQPQQIQGPTTGMGLPELEEWGFRGHSAQREEVPPEPPVMYQVYLEGGKTDGDGRWYWGLEKGEVDDGIWREKMPISTSVVPVTSLTAHPDPPAPHPETDPTLGISTLSALRELLPHRWAFVRRLAPRSRKSISGTDDAAPATPPESTPRKVVTSLLIAMPTPHHIHAHSEGAPAVFEDEFPEVVFGVHEGGWADEVSRPMTPPQIDGAPINHVPSRV
ncbi:hypothetical protein FRB90_008644 [Tulasnella sp. 427]|nr:hypothetical protein FRB90_008644 [Tulasnella sp. 427]